MLALCSVSSITANTNSTNTTETPNGNGLKSFSCEWKDLEFPITYGPGIAASLCVLIGGFHLIFGEDRIDRCLHYFLDCLQTADRIIQSTRMHGSLTTFFLALLANIR